MTLSTLFWALSALAAASTLAWTGLVWWKMATTPLWTPVPLWVQAHPVAAGHLVDGRVHDDTLEPGFRLARRLGARRVLTFSVPLMTPGLNVVLVLTAVLAFVALSAHLWLYDLRTRQLIAAHAKRMRNSGADL